MRYLLAGPVFLFMVLLVAGAVTGRVRMQSCCSTNDPETSDPARDLRGKSDGSRGPMGNGDVDPLTGLAIDPTLRVR